MEPALKKLKTSDEFMISTSAARAWLKGSMAQVFPCMGRPFSDNFVASFNCMLSKLIGKLVREISGAAGTDNAFERAVEGALPGSLTEYANVEAKKMLEKWEKSGGFSENYLADVQKELGAFSLPDADTVRLIGVCDYILLEHMESSGNQLEDDKTAILTTVAAHDLRALLQYLDSGEERGGEHSDDQAVKSLLQPRYLPFSWAYCEFAIVNDEELTKFWESLGIALAVCHSTTTEPTPQNTRDDKLIGSCGMGGLGLGASTPCIVPMATLRYFCMEYGAVDHLLLCTEEDKPEEGDGYCSQDPNLPMVADMLNMCRDPLKSEVEVDLEDLKGASLLQIFGALLIRAHEGSLCKLTLKSYDSQDAQFLYWSEIVSTLFSEEVFELVFDQDTLADVNILMFGESFNHDWRCNNSVACKLAWTGNTKLMSQMFSKLATMESKVHADCSGLHDEDMQGEFSALHCAAYTGNVAMATLLLDKGIAIDEHSFDSTTPLHVAVAEGNTDVVSLLLERKADANNQKVRDPGWQNNMPIMAGFTTVHTAINYGCTPSLQLLLKAKANTDTLTGPISSCAFSKHCFVEVTEYNRAGHSYAPLHLAVQQSSAASSSSIVELLLEHSADVDVRAIEGAAANKHNESYDDGFGAGGDEEVRVHPLVRDDMWSVKSTEFEHALSTPLHLSKHPESTSLLLARGACLLAQDFNGQAAGLANNGAAVIPWLRRLFASEGCWIWLICHRKELSGSVASVIFSFLVQMHLADHVQQAMGQELSPTKWPIVAFSMTQDDLWPAHGATICNAIVEVNSRDCNGNRSRYRYRYEDEDYEEEPELPLPELDTAHPDLAVILRERLLDNKRKLVDRLSLSILCILEAARTPS